MDDFVHDEMRGRSGRRRLRYCFHPLHEILEELERTHIDYFSLDVEGSEIEILQTIPFNAITIDVISVEYKVKKTEMSTNFAASREKLNRIRRFMASTNLYDEHCIVHISDTPVYQLFEANGLDVIFKRKDLNIPEYRI